MSCLRSHRRRLLSIARRLWFAACPTGARPLPIRSRLLALLAAALLAGCASGPVRVPPVLTAAPETTGVAAHAMVAAANPMAVEAGVAVLRRGGTAADAAVAVQMVLGLVEPQSSGLGGGAFMVFYEAR